MRSPTPTRRDASIRIRDRRAEDDVWVREALSSAWGSCLVVSRGQGHQAHELPGLIAEADGQPVGFLTYRIADDEIEVVTLQAFRRRAGVGRTLLDAACRHARERDCRRVWLITTNDNAVAIEFYRRVGMRLVAVHRGAVAQSRRLKPQIPLVGASGVPIEDEWEFEVSFEGPTARGTTR
jgi:ribosomal protein S18 acetylase RimI-like enzyme